MNLKNCNRTEMKFEGVTNNAKQSTKTRKQKINNTVNDRIFENKRYEKSGK